MGDRANIVIKTNGEQVCLYSHWRGSDLPNTLRVAMVRGKDRWNDAPYLARIIFCEMVKGNERETTGFGISQSIGDGCDRVLTLDVDTQTVKINTQLPIGFGEFVAGTAGW